MAYNNVFRLLFGYRRSCNASEMFVNNNMYTFEGCLRKNINDFTMRIGSFNRHAQREVLFLLVLSGRNGLRVFILFIISVVIV